MAHECGRQFLILKIEECKSKQWANCPRQWEDLPLSPSPSPFPPDSQEEWTRACMVEGMGCWGAVRTATQARECAHVNTPPQVPPCTRFRHPEHHACCLHVPARVSQVSFHLAQESLELLGDTATWVSPSAGPLAGVGDGQKRGCLGCSCHKN